MASSMPIKVLGLGNILLSDEGLGVKALWELKEKYEFSPEVELVDGGTGGLLLLSEFEGVEKLLIIDAISGGKPPGTIYSFSLEELPESVAEKISLHEVSLLDVLQLARLKGCLPEEVRLIGMEPASLEMSTELTEKIKERLPELINLALEELKKWGVEAREKRG